MRRKWRREQLRMQKKKEWTLLILLILLTPMRMHWDLTLHLISNRNHRNHNNHRNRNRERIWKCQVVPAVDGGKNQLMKQHMDYRDIQRDNKRVHQLSMHQLIS